MRVMNGRLPTLLRSPLMRSSQPNSNGHHHHYHRRRSSEMLPKMVQFDESADAYRCLCSCFHVKTGTLFIAGTELLLILFYFLNALVVLLQQKNSYDYARGERQSDYVRIAFIATGVGCGMATIAVLMMIVGVVKNIGSLLYPHLIVQIFAILALLALLIIGVIAVVTDVALFYRLLNAAPFHEYPGQNTVALPMEITVRVYFVLFIHFIALLLEIYSFVVIYNCQQYFAERKQYMRYCMAYSKPMETLNSAR